jgi:hypothetical protein
MQHATRNTQYAAHNTQHTTRSTQKQYHKIPLICAPVFARADNARTTTQSTATQPRNIKPHTTINSLKRYFSIGQGICNFTKNGRANGDTVPDTQVKQTNYRP